MISLVSADVMFTVDLIMHQTAIPVPDTDDQARAVQRPRAAHPELGALPAQVQAQEPGQAQAAQEEDGEEGVHTLPSAAA